MIKSGNDSFKNFKLGVIFDFDGTLFDDIHLTHDIVFKLAEYYRPDLPKEEVEKIYNEIAEYLSGISKKIVLLKALLHAGKRFKLNWFKRIKLISVTKDIYEEEIKKCKLFPDVRYVMDALKEKEYIALGLFTSTPIKIVKARLGEKDETHKNLLNYFDTIMTPEYYSKMKPHPSGILNIVRKWKLPKEKILMVGDMTLDINAAKSAGVIAVGITTGYDSKEVLEKAGADYIINSLSELIPLLDKILEK